MIYYYLNCKRAGVYVCTMCLIDAADNYVCLYLVNHLKNLEVTLSKQIKAHKAY